MRTKDFIPSKDKDCLAWVIVFLQTLSSIMGRILFPGDRYKELVILSDDFSTKLAVTENPNTRTPPAIVRKKDARKTLVTAIRKAVKEYITGNHLVSDDDRSALGLPLYKTTRTPAPIATSHPDFDVDSSMLRRLSIDFYDQGNKKSKAKPDGQHGAEIKWAILDAPPASLSELINSSFDTRTPFTLEFDQNQRGKTVYFCLCWENTRGEKGPWSEIVSAIVP